MMPHRWPAGCLIHNASAPAEQPSTRRATLRHGEVRGDRLTGVSRRFLTLADVAELLNVSASQAYALVRSGDLRGIKIGGRGQWRVEETELERFIAERYEQTERFIAEHPFARADDTDDALAPDSTNR